MESAEILRQSDRAAASPFIDHPRSPGWYSPAVGLWWAGLAVMVHLYLDGRTVAASILLAALLVSEMAVIAWLRRRWGVWPRMAQAPAEVKSTYHRFVVGVVLVALVAALAWWQLGWVVGVVVIAVAMTALHAFYRLRAYPAAAERVRERLR
ncbi:hypothetical protein [uncultured Cellulomonas sp.]|uniref:hypothetical protein n=1 Tax=uncultured Cellulomonas sp. TaxID=189682 RepID=UPI00260E193B|nr:hypothetical protein [uncultured Cellulomonas sp.]